MLNRNKTGLVAGSALGLVLGLSALAAPAFAQDAPKKDEAKAATDVDELVIVGSRIRRDTFNSPSPVQVVTRDESTLAGFNSTTAALQSTAVTGGSAQINNAYGGYVTNGGPGANTLSLRGLGASRTLILLNGRRVAPAGSRGSVGSADLNVLPSAMIDRIEILKDGASSIYGSDAIAGVVNIITIPKVDRITVEGQYNKTYDGGGDEQRYSIVGGITRDRFSLSGSLEYYKRDELTLGDRDWTQCNTDYRINRAISDIPGSGDYIDPKTGLAKCYPITGTGSNGVTINTIGTGPIAGIGAVGSSAPGQTANFIRWRPNAAINSGLIGYEGVGGNINVRDTFDQRMLKQSLISPAEVYTGYAQGSFDLQALGNAEIYFEVLGNERKSQQTGYRQLSLDYAEGSPLLPTQLQTSVVQQPGPTNLTNGKNLGVRAFIGFGNDTSEQTVKFYKTTGGIRGDFFLPGWRYDVSASYTKSDADYTFQSFITSRLAKSLNVVASGSGFACVDPTGGCIAAPSLTAAVVGGQLPQDWVNYVFRPVTGSTLYDETVVTAAVDGSLFKLPYGEVKGAFGLEYRKAKIDDTPPLESQTGDLFNLTSAAITRGTDSVWEAYGELDIPILANLPFAKELSLNVSGRYTDYDSYGSGSTYKVGLIYTPVDFISLRGTYGTSYRAPALFEQFQGGTSGFLNPSADPCNEYGQGDPSSIRYANCNAELNNPNFTPTSGVTVITAGGSAQGLKAETSKNYTFGIILQPTLPSYIGDISFAVDYYDIKVENGVDRVGAQGILQRCYDDPQFRAGGGYCRFINQRVPGSNALTVFDSYTNIATQRVRGIDYTLRYNREVGPGTLRLNAQVTQYISQASKLFEEDPVDEYNGTLNNPEFTGTFDASYTYQNWKIRYGLEWVAAMDSTEYLGLDPATSPYVFNVPDYFIHSLSVQYKADDWSITAGMRNIGDTTPPPISQGAYNRVGNAPLYSGYDYVGRTAFVNVSKSF